MKKIIISLIFILFICSLSSCSIFDKQGGTIYLENSHHEITLEEYNSICKKHGIGETKTYKVFDSYQSYLSFYTIVSTDNVDIEDQEKDRESFNKNVKLCRARKELGKNTICKPSYAYSSSKNEINSFYSYFKNEEYKEDDVKYFIDFIEVPNDIYKKLKNNEKIKFV